jgi:hypothetical protein
MPPATSKDPARAASNRLFLKISGRRLRAYSIVKHVGRRSGREFVNPASAYPLGDGFVIPIPIGRPLVPVGQPIGPPLTGATPPSAVDPPQRAAELVAAQFDTVAAVAEGCVALMAGGGMPVGVWR